MISKNSRLMTQEKLISKKMIIKMSRSNQMMISIKMNQLMITKMTSRCHTMMLSSMIRSNSQRIIINKRNSILKSLRSMRTSIMRRNTMKRNITRRSTTRRSTMMYHSHNHLSLKMCPNQHHQPRRKH